MCNEEIKQLATKIIKKIRDRKDYNSDMHQKIDIGSCSVEYYDTKETDDWFIIKQDGIEYNNSYDSFTIKILNEIDYTNFDLYEWLKQIDVLVPEVHKIVIDGKIIEISEESYQNLKKSLLE